MADVASGFRSFLVNNTGTNITSIVGAGALARIIPDDLPQDIQLPCVIYSKISTNHEHVIGSDWGRGGMATCRLELECYASTRSASSSLADTIMDCVCGPLYRLRGVYGGVNFLDVMVGQGARTFNDTPTDGSDERRYVTVVEFMVSYLDE
jgi:hypothetical protein